MPRRRSPDRSRRRALAGLVAIALATAACRDDARSLETADARPLETAAFGAQPLGAQEPPAPARVRAAAGADVAASRRTALVEATSRVAASVVSINVTARQRITPRTAWDFFFIPEGAERRVQSYGTGFVIRPDGIILTNQHVVANADQIVVTLPDGTDEPARLLGEDPLTDIAVLKIDRQGLPAAPLGRSTDLMIGEWVVALGNPYAYLLGNPEPTVTAGVVSATGRNILPNQEQTGLYLDMIQTDAAINPGNSGGPLTNALGEVVGVNSSILSSTGGSIGLGFAIPIERAVRVADEIIRTGTVRRAWTGLQVEGAMGEWKRSGGVRVTEVDANGPAGRAGIRVGDVIVEANGRRVRNFLDWEAVKLDLHVGDPVEITVRQGDHTVRRKVVTGDLPTVMAEKVTVLQDMQLVNVTPSIQAERGVRSERGALIYRISPAVSRATGLREGDVIVGINRMAVRSAEQVAELLGSVRAGTIVRVYYERDGRFSFTDLAFR